MVRRRKQSMPKLTALSKTVPPSFFNPASCILQMIIALVILYWAYIAYMTQPILMYDAQSFVDLGIRIHDNGWKEYFISGPNREPFYPFLIALSMTIAGKGGYLGVLKVFQLILLLVSGSLFLTILKQGKLSMGLMISAVIYMGISPAIVNSAFSLFSEGVTYSFILGLILFGSSAWRKMQVDKNAAMIIRGAAFGGCCIGITMIKGIYEMIFPILIIPFVLRAILNPKVRNNTLIFIITTLLVFGSCLSGYKALNKKYNGLFVLTDRASWAFYGSAARRVMPMDAHAFGAAVASALLTEEGCKRIFSTVDCEAWNVRKAEYLGAQKNYEIIAHYPPKEQNHQFRVAAFTRIHENPLQYLLLTGLEWIHMFYWETTQIGFVAYPDWLERIFNQGWGPSILRFTVGTLSLFSIVFSLLFLLKNHRYLMDPVRHDHPSAVLLFFLGGIAICHVSLYSLFAIVPRHAVPIGPVFILLIILTVPTIRKT